MSGQANMTEQIPIAIVGLNFGTRIAEHDLAQAAGSAFFALAAVCDQDTQRADEAGARLGVKAYHHLDDVLARADIPAIGLFTGPAGRADLIRRIIRAGKHVMTTKPFELDSGQAAAVLQEARRLGRLIHLNSPSASRAGDFLQMDTWIRQYGLGRPVAGTHESWYKRVEIPDGTWYDDPERCPVAPIFRLGIYGIHDLLCLLGQPDTVQVTQSRLFTGRPTPDLAQLTLRFRNGAIGTSLAGWCLQPPRAEHCLTLYFENGTIHRSPALTPDPPDHFTLCVAPADSRNGAPAEAVTLPREQLSSAYQWETFHNAIRGQAIRNPTPDGTIVDGVRVIEAMKRSAASGRTEAVRDDRAAAPGKGRS